MRRNRQPISVEWLPFFGVWQAIYKAPEDHGVWFATAHDKHAATRARRVLRARLRQIRKDWRLGQARKPTR